MHTLWLTLAWKEWHEHKWQLLSLTAIALSVFVVCAIEAWDTVATAVYMAIIGYALLAPIFVAMTVCASEHSQRTIRFIAAQPVPMWKMATVRLFAGAAVLITPILVVRLVGLLVTSILPQQYGVAAMDAEGLPSGVMVIGVMMSLNLYAWIVAIAVNQRTELRAGLIGLVVTGLLMALGVMGLSGFGHHPNWLPPFSLISLISGPLCGFVLFDTPFQFPDGLALLSAVWQAVLLIALGIVIVVRYGRPGFSLSRLWESPKSSAGIAGRPLQPIASPMRALFWMQWRQSVPICLAGTALLVLIAIIVRDVFRGFDRGTIVLLGSLALLLAAALSLLLGTVGFTNDLEPKLYAFWRSRPISPSAWFWLRYAAGLLAIIVFFVLPISAIGVLYVLLPIVLSVGADATGAAPLLLFLPLVSLVVYSLGVFCACSVRHPVYSIILAVCAALFVLFVPAMLNSLQPISITGLLEQAGRMTHDGDFGAARRCLLYAVALAGAVSAAATIAAATLIKRDIYLRT